MDRRERLVRAAASTPKTEPGVVVERWAFAPGISREDIAAAEVETREWYAWRGPEGQARPPGSASPVHLVAARKMRERLDRERQPL